MSINPIIIRQNFKIGELDAESDTLLLENCFIDSGYLSKLLNPSDTSSIVIGRTGAEKVLCCTWWQTKHINIKNLTLMIFQ